MRPAASQRELVWLSHLSVQAVVLVSRFGEGRAERECFETLMRSWRRPQDSLSEPTAVKAQGVSHEQ